MPSLHSETRKFRRMEFTRRPVQYLGLHAEGSLTSRNIPLLPWILGLKTLTKLTLLDYNFHPRLDILLEPSEENHLLESATPGISFPGA